MILPSLAALLCALAYLGLTTRPASALRSAVKTAAVALLALAAAAGGAPMLLVLALALCALGDFCLSRPGALAFMAGVGAFAAGHLAYIALFLSREAADPARLAGLPQLAALTLLIALGAVMARLLAPRAGGLRGAVLAYIPVILGMAAAALTLPPALAVAAAAAFLLSDIILAFETFVLAPGHPLRRTAPYAIWPLYWGAQAGFLAAFAAF
ncbi:MAG: lysoplasmalogenase family protein [Pseudodonghicola sp.]